MPDSRTWRAQARRRLPVRFVLDGGREFWFPSAVEFGRVADLLDTIDADAPQVPYKQVVEVLRALVPRSDEEAAMWADYDGYDGTYSTFDDLRSLTPVEARELQSNLYLTYVLGLDPQDDHDEEGDDDGDPSLDPTLARSVG